MDFIFMIPDGSAQTSTLYTVEDCIWTRSLLLLLIAMLRCSSIDALWVAAHSHHLLYIFYIGH